MVAPWFGRQALTWVVDMSSIGVTIAYFYTCYTAFSLFKWNKNNGFNANKHVVSPGQKIFALLGMVASIAFLGLLLIPGSPAFLGVESRIALIVWVVLGILFYIMKYKDYKNLDKEEMNYLILGSKEIKVKKD